jgi:DNA-binding transcriptional MocR family regulator
MVAVPIAIDDRGLLPDALEKRLVQGIDALIVTPRAQNPTGAALDPLRATQLRALLAPYADLLVIEDDHAGPVSGVPAQTLCIERSRFAVVRSHSKALGPDLRVASLAGDAETVARIEGRQLIGIRWVSHVLQGLVAALLSQQGTPSLLRRAASRYRQRREALLAQLASRGVEAHGRSGLNVWIPVPEEAAAVSALLERGWAVSAGERFRLGAGSAIRVTTATLLPRESALLARDLADQLSPVARTYSA